MQIKVKLVCEFLKERDFNAATHESCAEYIETHCGKKFSAEGKIRAKSMIEELHAKVLSALNNNTQPGPSDVLSKIPNVNEFFLIDQFFESPEESSNDDSLNDEPAHRPVGRPRVTDFSLMKGGTKRRYIQKKVKEWKEIPGCMEIAKKICRSADDNNSTGFNDSAELPKTLPIKRISEKDAYNLIRDKKLSRETYDAIRAITDEHGAKIFPYYSNIQKYKNSLRPAKANDNESNDDQA